MDELWSTAILQMSALALCPYLALHFLRKKSLSLSRMELILSLLVSYISDFLEDDFGMNRM